jgi:hypothetical protein
MKLQIYFAALGTLFLTCAVHPPASEMLMFKKENNTATWSGGMMLSHNFFNKDNYYQKAYNSFEDRDHILRFKAVNSNKSGVGAHIIYYPDATHAACSMTWGYPCGIDITAELFKKSFLTIGASAGGFQAIIQKPIMVGQWSFSSGVYYRNEVQYFDIDRVSSNPYDEEIFEFYYSDTLNEKSVGLRCTLAVFPQFNSTLKNTGFYSNLHIGYSSLSDQMVVLWSICYGSY